MPQYLSNSLRGDNYKLEQRNGHVSWPSLTSHSESWALPLGDKDRYKLGKSQLGEWGCGLVSLPKF